MLYPLKFKPILKNRIWGGDKLGTLMNKSVKDGESIGESWELSGLEGNESIVENGYLAGNNINELIEVYLDELVGQKVYDAFGQTFPLLFKFIDADDKLSVQVHPDDDMAKELYGTNGKTEMWYVIDAEEGAELYIGFNGEVDAKQCEEHIKNGTLADILTVHKVKKGDAFFIPAGTVHAIGKGIILAEIQQSSDITYRLFDYDRKDKDGNKRELHLENALNALHYEYKGEAIRQLPKENVSTEIVKSDAFKTNVLKLTKPTEYELGMRESFTVFMCVEGSATIESEASADLQDEHDTKVEISKGETVLIPSSLYNFSLTPGKEVATLLEIWIE